MYAKKIKFEDFNGVEREQTFHFHLMESELLELQASIGGEGFTEYVKRLLNTNDTPKLADLFKKMILMSYGEKSDDGMRFIKTDPVRGKLAAEFAETNAYSELYSELISDPNAASEFFNRVIPAKLAEKLEQAQAEKPITPTVV